DHTGLLQAFAVVHQAMDTGDADVVDGIDFVAHDFGGDLRFFGDENIAGAGADDGDASFAGYGAVAPEADRAGDGKMLAFRKGFEYNARGFRRGSGDENVFRTREQGARDGDDLIRRFAQAENDFGHPVTQRAVVIDLGESEILERHMPHAFHRVVNAGGSGADVFEERTKLFLTHVANIAGTRR